MAPATRLYCENENEEKFIIELQNVKQQYFKDRSIFYSTFPIQSQAPKGRKWDYYLNAVYTIGILNFSFPDQAEEDRYLREVQLIDKETSESGRQKEHSTQQWLAASLATWSQKAFCSKKSK